jgi:hypothetical protein
VIISHRSSQGMATLGLSLTPPWSLLYGLGALAALWCAWRLLASAWLGPRRMAWALRSQGLGGTAYRFPSGDLPPEAAAPVSMPPEQQRCLPSNNGPTSLRITYRALPDLGPPDPDLAHTPMAGRTAAALHDNHTFDSTSRGRHTSHVRSRPLHARLARRSPDRALPCAA